MNCDYFTVQGWQDLQLIFWEARYKANQHKHKQEQRGFEYCRDSHSYWIRRTTYGDNIKRGFYREDSEPDTEG